MLTVHGAHFVQPGRLVLARVTRVPDRALAPWVAGPVHRAIAAVLAPARAQLLIAPVTVAGLRALARRLSSVRQRARPVRTVTVAHARLAVLALESRGARARPIGVQHALVLANVPQHFVRDQFRGRFRGRRHRDVLLKRTTLLILLLRDGEGGGQNVRIIVLLLRDMVSFHINCICR